MDPDKGLGKFLELSELHSETARNRVEQPRNRPRSVCRAAAVTSSADFGIVRTSVRFRFRHASSHRFNGKAQTWLILVP